MSDDDKAADQKQDPSSDPLAFTVTVQDPGSAQDSERAKVGSSALMATVAILQDGSDVVADVMAESEIAPFAPGYVLADRWKIVDRIGKGGFGFVYSAKDLELDVTVAVKVLRPEHETSAATIQQFKQEIQLARQVTHKNVCRIYDVGFYSQGDLRIPFLTMELLEGQPLDERLRDGGPLALDEVEVIALQVVNALEAAHNAGIVHADLKPANIMLIGSGANTRAVVADFGLASAHANAARQSKESTVVGTPAYMAPEQVEGKTLEPAADFYALGCTLFQIISGQLPFHADTPVTTARARLEGPPPSLSKANQHIPARWIAVVRDLMAVDISERLVTPSKIRRRLRKPRHARNAVIVVSALVVLISAQLVFNFASDALQRPEPFELAEPSDPQARALDRKGQSEWQAYQIDDAAATWQGALDAGHRHPRIYMRVCGAHFEKNRLDDFHKCTKSVVDAALILSDEGKLSKDEKHYYEAYYLGYSGKPVKAIETLGEMSLPFADDYEIGRLRARIHRGSRQYADAIETLKKVEPRSKKQAISILTSECNIRIEQQRYEEATALATSLLQATEVLGFERERVLLLDNLAQAARNTGHLESSLHWATESLALAQKLGSIQLQANAISLQVGVYMQRREFTKALKHVIIRQKFLRANNDSLAANQMDVTRVEILMVVGRPKEALELLSNMTLPKLRDDKNSYWLAYAKLVRSNIRQLMFLLDEALEDCRSAEDTFRQIRNPRLMAFAQMVCAGAHLEKGELDEAKELLDAARVIRSELKLEINLWQNDLVDAEVLLLEGKPEEALAMAKKVSANYVERGLPSKEIVALELMARSAVALRDPAAATLAIGRAIKLGAAEDLVIDLQLRHTDLLVRSLSENKAEILVELDALHTEATAYGYLARAHKIAKTRDSLQATEATGSGDSEEPSAGE
jgi:serine/threonine protein kinase